MLIDVNEAYCNLTRRDNTLVRIVSKVTNSAMTSSAKSTCACKDKNKHHKHLLDKNACSYRANLNIKLHFEPMFASIHEN